MKHLRLRLFRLSGGHNPPAPTVSSATAATKAHAAASTKSDTSSKNDAAPNTAPEPKKTFVPPSSVPSGPFSQELNAQQRQLLQHEQQLEKLNFSLSPYANDEADDNLTKNPKATLSNTSVASTNKSYADDDEGFSVTLNVAENEQPEQIIVKPPFLHFKLPLKYQPPAKSDKLSADAAEKAKLPPISPRFYDDKFNPWLSKPFTPFGIPSPALPSTTSQITESVHGGKIERVLDREVRDCDQLWYFVVYADEDLARKRPRWVPFFYICDEQQVKSFEINLQQKVEGTKKGLSTSSKRVEVEETLEERVLSARTAAASKAAVTTAAAETLDSNGATLKGSPRPIFKQQSEQQPPVFTPTRRKCYQPAGTYKQIDPADTQLSIVLPNNLPPIYVIFPRTSKVSDVRQWLRKHVSDLHVEEFVMRNEMPFYRETTMSESAGETLEDSGFSDTQLHVRLVSGGAYGNFDDPYSLCSNSWRTSLDYNELIIDGGPVA